MRCPKPQPASTPLNFFMGASPWGSGGGGVRPTQGGVRREEGVKGKYVASAIVGVHQ